MANRTHEPGCSTLLTWHIPKACDCAASASVSSPEPESKFVPKFTPIEELPAAPASLGERPDELSPRTRQDFIETIDWAIEEIEEGRMGATMGTVTLSRIRDYFAARSSSGATTRAEDATP